MGTCRATDWYLDLVLLLEICDYKATYCASVGEYYYKQKDREKQTKRFSLDSEVFVQTSTLENATFHCWILEARSWRKNIGEKILEAKSRRKDPGGKIYLHLVCFFSSVPHQFQIQVKL